MSRIRIKIRAYDNKIIDQATKTIIETAQRNDAKVIGPVPLPTEKLNSPLTGLLLSTKTPANSLKCAYISV